MDDNGYEGYYSDMHHYEIDYGHLRECQQHHSDFIKTCNDYVAATANSNITHTKILAIMFRFTVTSQYYTASVSSTHISSLVSRASH